MSAFVSEILQLSPILQGALGSALFAALMWLGQLLVRGTHARATSFSKKRRAERLLREYLRASAIRSKSLDRASKCMALLTYSSMEHVAKALIYLVLGFILGNIVQIFSVVGYLFSLFQLFEALDCVRKWDPKRDAEEAIKEIKEELRQLGQPLDDNA